MMLARARDKGLQFDCRIGDNLPGAIVGDATRLRQILVNLCSNAIKFTERGRVELSVACIERTPTRAQRLNALLTRMLANMASSMNGPTTRK